MRFSNLVNIKSPQPTLYLKNFGLYHSPFKHRFSFGKERPKFTVKERNSETSLYYYGSRYLEPKTSRWISADPAVGECLPSAPVDDDARKRNNNLPNDGICNYTNIHTYHYSNNNPVKYVDLDWRRPVFTQALISGKWHLFTDSKAKSILFSAAEIVIHFFGDIVHGISDASIGTKSISRGLFQDLLGSLGGNLGLLSVVEVGKLAKGAGWLSVVLGVLNLAGEILSKSSY